MSKKDKIVEMLKKDTNTEDICTELGVSTSYVYRIKREMDELEGDTDDSSETENDNLDDLAVDSTSGSGNNVEGNHEDVEKKETVRETNENNRLGGVKKSTKKRTKRIKKEMKSIESEQSEQSERTGGVLQWMKKQWKKMLLILTFLILLVIMMLSSFQTKKPETTQDMQVNQPRFPVLTR